MTETSSNTISNLKILACIVLYKNDLEMLQKTIKSFLNTELKVKLVLIDNSPTDELKILLTDSRIEYMHNPSNPGFGAAHNIAIKQSIGQNAQYHLVLNPDIYFSGGVLEGIVQFMDDNRKIGHLMPKICNPDGSLQYLCKTNPTVFDLFARGFLPSFIKNRIKKRLDSYEYKNADHNDLIFDIPYLSGCFMFFRTDILKNVGYFDDAIFMYLEDADITRRFLELSQTVYYPFEKVFHHYAGLTHKQWKYKWITVQSAITYFNKWGWIKNII